MQFDNTSSKDNNNEYNEGDVIVKREDMKPLNDVNCEHKFKQDSDEIGGNVAWVCTECGRGLFLPKGTTIT